MLDEEPDDRVFTLLNVAFVVLLVLLLWNASGYDLAPGVVTHTIGPCDLDRRRGGRRWCWLVRGRTSLGGGRC